MKLTKKLKNKSGFTIIELVVAMAIMGILGGVVASLVTMGTSSYQKVNTDLDYQTQARTAMSFITVQLRQHDEAGLVLMTDGSGVSTDTFDGSGRVYFCDKDPATVPGTPGKYIEIVGDELSYVSFSDKGDSTTYLDAIPIAVVRGLNITKTTANGRETYDITVEYGDGRQMTESIALRHDAA